MPTSPPSVFTLEFQDNILKGIDTVLIWWYHLLDIDIFSPPAGMNIEN
jgi:hypothetical protein